MVRTMNFLYPRISQHHIRDARINGLLVRGFTLIEMIVVVGILVVITAITLANQGRFGERILLRNLAYDVALTFHEAQIYGISAKRIADTAFAVGHGIAIDMNTPNVMTRFADVDGNHVYNNPSTEFAGTYQFSRAYRIETICGETSGGSEVCGLQDLFITFRRPEPDASVFGTYASVLGQYAGARIIIISPRDDRVEVLIESSGQISVQKYTP